MVARVRAVLLGVRVVLLVLLAVVHQRFIPQPVYLHFDSFGTVLVFHFDCPHFLGFQFVYVSNDEFEPVYFEFESFRFFLVFTFYCLSLQFIESV